MRWTSKANSCLIISTNTTTSNKALSVSWLSQKCRAGGAKYFFLISRKTTVNLEWWMLSFEGSYVLSFEGRCMWDFLQECLRPSQVSERLYKGKVHFHHWILNLVLKVLIGRHECVFCRTQLKSMCFYTVWILPPVSGGKAEQRARLLTQLLHQVSRMAKEWRAGGRGVCFWPVHVCIMLHVNTVREILGFVNP